MFLVSPFLVKMKTTLFRGCLHVIKIGDAEKAVALSRSNKTVGHVYCLFSKITMLSKVQLVYGTCS